MQASTIGLVLQLMMVGLTTNGRHGAIAMAHPGCQMIGSALAVPRKVCIMERCPWLFHCQSRLC